MGCEPQVGIQSGAGGLDSTTAFPRVEEEERWWVEKMPSDKVLGESASDLR